VPGKKKQQDSESRLTVLLALLANIGVGILKLIAGLITGSSALLSEAAHSAGDSTTEVLLLVAQRRSRKRADRSHPFGYGKERFFWSLIAAVGIFVLGAGFSFLEAIEAFTSSGGGKEAYLWAYIMLGVAFVLEGTSWLRAVWQTRKEAAEREKGVVQHIRESSDPTVKTVASEDTAALIGLVLAFAGLLLHQITGESLWEGIASVGIGLTLVFVAYALARDAKGLLIGEAADERTRQQICDILEGYDGVDEVLEVLTMRIGTDQLLVAVRLDFGADLESDRVEELSARIDCDLHEQVPEVYQVFLDATDKETRRERPDTQPYPDESHGARHTEQMAATPDS
jgi:cation diffusion facilitator family transporter